jgi:hypothetical protein
MSLAADAAGDDASRRMRRHAETIDTALNDLGVSAQDHDNTPFSSGTSLRVLAFQPVPGLNAETVIETVKPSIYFQGQLIQVAEVIVGTPDIPPADTSTENGE